MAKVTDLKTRAACVSLGQRMLQEGLVSSSIAMSVFIDDVRRFSFGGFRPLCAAAPCRIHFKKFHLSIFSVSFCPLPILLDWCRLRTTPLATRWTSRSSTPRSRRRATRQRTPTSASAISSRSSWPVRCTLRVEVVVVG